MLWQSSTSSSSQRPTEMISIFKCILCIECILTIFSRNAMASDEISTTKLGAAFMTEPSEEHVLFIPLDDNHLRTTTNLVRRNDFFYAKNLKTLPRIGRRNDFFSKLPYGKNIPTVTRRDELSVIDKDRPNSWPWPKTGKYIPIVMKKNAGNFDDQIFAGHS